jgi:hypothetical protein|tara:strand:+ start:202 stop:423 length:222 start_codon:yes stop_codon:yes gene_type:complete
MEEILINLLTQYPIASTIIVVLAALHPVASAITALTETPKDDGIVAKIYKVIEWLALVNAKVKRVPTIIAPVD